MENMGNLFMKIFGKKLQVESQTAVNQNQNQNQNENQQEQNNYEKVIIMSEISNQLAMFKYLKQELFDSIANKDGNFSGEYEIKSRSGSVLFKAKGNINDFMSYEYLDKSGMQGVYIEDTNGDGNMNSIFIKNADGTSIYAFDKDDDGNFEVINKINKDLTRTEY